MTENPKQLEQQLIDDLRTTPHLVDNQSADGLYRALAENVWRKHGHDGRLAVSWKEAESVVNRLRAETGLPPLTLAQTGDEGKVARTVEETLGGIGWTHTPLDTGNRDAAHIERGESPPRREPSEAEWERTGPEEAERARLGVDPPPATASTGAGGGKG